MLAADASHTGYIDLISWGVEGSEVTFGERVGRRFEKIGASRIGPHGVTAVVKAAEWRCDRLIRRFEIATVDPQGRHGRGRFSVRTPSCRHRVSLEVPREVQPGARFTARVVDAWGLGRVRVELCTAFEQGRRVCRPLEIAEGSSSAERQLSLPRRGGWRVWVRFGESEDARLVGAGVAAPAETVRPVVLSTGDSTIQGIEGFLEERLPGRARIAREYLPGSGISRPIQPQWPYWPAVAQRLAHDRLPSLTVISIGANDGHTMDVRGVGRIECCGEAWIGEYSRRVREIMATLTRGGQARVLWLTLPAPLGHLRHRTSAAVNTAIRRAASGQTNVRLVELDHLFTPGFRYRERMRFRGRRLRVREPDGIHLSAAGQDIAARAVSSAIAHWPGSLAR